MNSAPEMLVLEFERTAKDERFEDEIRCRLNRLGELVTGAVDSPYLGVLRERNSIREVLDELAVKEATLQWIHRTAKHSRGVVRYALWLQLARALVDFEKIGKEIAHPDSSASTMAPGGAPPDALHGRCPALEV